MGLLDMRLIARVGRLVRPGLDSEDDRRKYFGFVRLSLSLMTIVVTVVAGYVIVTEAVKVWAFDSVSV